MDIGDFDTFFFSWTSSLSRVCVCEMKLSRLNGTTLYLQGTQMLLS